MKFYALLVLGLGLLGASTASNASCVCSCINGSMEAVCSNSIEVAPICPPRVCPITPASVQPINPPTVPPIGTKQCTQEQVYNENARKYEWKQICR